MECRKHHHQNHQGVCPSCLRERLSRVSTGDHHYNSNRISHLIFSNNHSSAYFSSSSSAAGDVSPVRARVTGDHRRVGSMSFVVRKGLSGKFDSGLKKSRSIAFVPGDDNRLVGKGMKKEMEKKKTKRGFWSRLLHLKGKSDKENGFLYSSALR